MSATKSELLHVTVDIWHPSCWTLETTREVDAGLYAHTTIPLKHNSSGLYTFYGHSQEALNALIGSVRESALTESVTVLSRPPINPESLQGSTTQPVLVEFESSLSIKQAFTSRGFIHYGPTRHEQGREQRSLIVRTDRRTLQQQLAEIEDEYSADITLLKLATASSAYNTPPSNNDQTTIKGGGHLTVRQREAFLLARSWGYYEYPRETTARELAAELGISKTTLLEHLRKAEAKLLTGSIRSEST
jgi:predicted DNA binding protein